jgi:hypothetical protein
MYQGSLAPVSNRENWTVTSPLIDDNGDEVTLTDAEFYLFVCRQGCPTTPVLSASTDAGTITLPTSTTFEWDFSPDDMAVLCAGTYDVFLRVTIDDVTTQILSATMQVVEGGPAA